MPHYWDSGKEEKNHKWHNIYIILLSGRTVHGDVQRTGVDGKGLGFNLCVAPPHDRVSQISGNGVHGVYKGIPEYTGEDGEDGED